MMPYCDYVSRLLMRRCTRPARHMHTDNEKSIQLAACDKHESWYRQKLIELGANVIVNPAPPNDTAH